MASETEQVEQVSAQEAPAEAAGQGAESEGLPGGAVAEDAQERATEAVDAQESSEGKGDSRGGSGSKQDKLRNILSMKVPVIVKVAEKRMPLATILKLNLGSVIQFEKDAYHHVELLVNNHTIGLGRPVKVGENFGLKIVEISEIEDTIRSLGGNVGREESKIEREKKG